MTQPVNSPLASPYSRKNPFLAEITSSEHLTRSGSIMCTRHCVFNLMGSGLIYSPGDALGVFARNPPGLAEEVMGLLGFDPETVLKNPRGANTTLRRTLTEDFILNRANRKIMSGLAE